MDWTGDNVGLSESDLTTVFRYAPGESTLVHLLRSKKYEVEITSMKDDDEWDAYLEKELATIEKGDESGLVLLMAKRSGEPAIHGISKASSNDWEKLASEKVPQHGPLARVKTFSALTGDALDALGTVGKVGDIVGSSKAATNRRGVRSLPFARETFERIAEGFHTHGSIARVISRSDVPIFSADQVEMDGRQAYVYNCRSSNAWENDLALSATYFPDRNLTFAILYGCPFSTEKEVIKRLSRVRAEAMHPLLMPGMFAELERTRHKKLVQITIARVETRIFELDVQASSSDLSGPQAEEAERRNVAKRTAWLDTTYLRNGMVSWSKTHLGRMATHAAELGDVVVVPAEKESPEGGDDDFPQRRRDLQTAAVAGRRIMTRIAAIKDEYDDWIRDCTMRVDGMAMATQWAQGETNVEIALATKRDSKHMRSIALLTMVFLPGTFLASVFSMTFFDWAPGADSTVSAYLWIYVVLAVVITLITVGVWYFFVVWRPSRMRHWEEDDDEEEEKAK